MRKFFLAALLAATPLFGSEPSRFQAVVIPEDEASALRAAQAKVDEAQAALTALRTKAEEKYKDKFPCRHTMFGCTWKWSLDFRVLTEADTAVSRSQGYVYLNSPLTSPAGVAQ